MAKIKNSYLNAHLHINMSSNSLGGVAITNFFLMRTLKGPGYCKKGPDQEMVKNMYPYFLRSTYSRSVSKWISFKDMMCC